MSSFLRLSILLGNRVFSRVENFNSNEGWIMYKRLSKVSAAGLGICVGYDENTVVKIDNEDMSQRTRMTIMGTVGYASGHVLLPVLAVCNFLQK